MCYPGAAICPLALIEYFSNLNPVDLDLWFFFVPIIPLVISWTADIKHFTHLLNRVFRPMCCYKLVFLLSFLEKMVIAFFNISVSNRASANSFSKAWIRFSSSVKLLLPLPGKLSSPASRNCLRHFVIKLICIPSSSLRDFTVSPPRLHCTTSSLKALS